MRFVAILLAALFFGSNGKAQVNIKIGYNIGFPQMSVNDAILSKYAPVNSELVQPFSSIGFMHGIQLGVRQRLGNVGIELGWENMSRDRTALSYNAQSDSFTDRKYSYSLNGLTFGVDNYIDQFGLGTSLIYQKLSVNRVIGNNNLSIINERQVSLRLQFIWQVQQSKLISVMIKPYYQIPLKGYDFTPLAVDIGVGGISELNETMDLFGLSLVFYNGRQ